ncbi:MAG: hypothetical protein ACKVS5_05825 [Parvularculaceae bacterium]
MQQATRERVAESAAPADLDWATENLRRTDGGVILDLANCLRIFERHPDYRGRFRYNDMLNKVVDRGAVMVEWRINEITADIQERFLPGLAVENVSKALFIAANRSSAK